MTACPKFKLSRLREIGCVKWDPIGLRGSECQHDDEYDSYLLQAAGRLWNGASQEDVADYLMSIESEYMRLGKAPGANQRAHEAAEALRSYVAELSA